MWLGAGLPSAPRGEGRPAPTHAQGWGSLRGETDEGPLGSISPRLWDMGPPRTPFNSWETGCTSSMRLRLPEHSRALAPRVHCVLRQSSEPWVNAEPGWARLLRGQCWRQPRGRGRGWRALDVRADFPSVQVWARAPWAAASSQGFPMRKSPSGRARATLSEANLGARECQHRRHTTWHLVPAEDPSKPGHSSLFVTPLGEAEQILSAPPHTPVTSVVFELSMGKQAAIRHRD